MRHNYFVLNVVQGLGPTLRLLEMGQELNRERRKEGKLLYGFVVPNLGDKHKLVMGEEFENSEFAQDIFIDNEYGKRIQKIFFSGKGGFGAFLEDLSKTYREKQGAISEHFQRPFEVVSFEKGTPKTLDREVCIELARNNIVRLPFNRGVSYGLGRRSEIIRKVVERGMAKYDPQVLEEVLPYLEEVEAQRNIDFVQDPQLVNLKKIGSLKPLYTLRNQMQIQRILNPGFMFLLQGFLDWHNKL